MSNAEVNNSFSTHSTSNVSNSTTDFKYKPFKNAVPELVPFSVAIILANSFVFVLFLKKKSIRTPANYLLLSLALCDFFTGCVNIPLTIMAFTQVVPYAKLPDVFYLVAVLHNFTAVVTGYHILVITAERYLLFVWEVRRPASKNAILKILGGVWGASAIIAIVPFFWKSQLYAKDPKASTLQTAHAIFCLAAVFLLPYTFIIYAYAVMFKAIKKTRRQMETMQNGSEDQAGCSSHEKRCLVIFVTMGTLYLVCWLPWFTLSLIFSLDASDGNGVHGTVSHVVAIVRYMTSVLNPVLYTFFKRDFFIAFKQVILRRRFEERVSFSALETARNSSRDEVY
ncbi:hypothetical protein OS493_023940 [Desmophyllum pertusum]|uniref:G-protein coupled receptors family 1 profile domain-containing protein n=1 Tax=Desmophyllum pertusum TaxID=174260 RepID=A0A9W9YDV9_9CNID|nr:hypothetical protein OS493_023940 [Desmophyllum pertusum]